jgi:uncharacterized protein DUF2834
MRSLLIHAALGLITIVLSFRFNLHLYRSGWNGARVRPLEALYYLIAVGSVCTGWYFNVQYMQTYPDQASWVHFTKLLFTNPAAGSGSQDLLTTNCLLFPLWTIVDGPRRGLKQSWIWFVMSLFTSFGFAMGLYLAAQERQVRWSKARP